MREWDDHLYQTTECPYDPQPMGAFTIIRGCVLLVRLLITMSFAATTTCAAAVFSVEGTCRFTTFTPSGAEVTECPFTISVSNRIWFLHMADIKTNVQVGYWEISYDGKYTYSLVFQEEWVQIARAHYGTGQYENVAVGIVAPHEVPHFPFQPQSAVIWLAYASGCYFASASSPRLEPAASLGVGPRGVDQTSFLRQKAYWTCSRQPPYLPSSVVYLDDGIIDPKGSGGQPLRWPEPLDAGFTNTVYQVLEYTNLGPLELPVRAGMKTFSARFHVTGGRTTSELALFYEYEVQATNFITHLVQTGAFRPRIPGVTLIDDERFTTSDPNRGLSYRQRENRWLDDSEVRALPEYRVAAARASAVVSAAVREPASLKGKPLPDLAPLGLGPTDAPPGQPLLALLIDAEQRPSRRALRLLAQQAPALKQKGLAIVVLQAGTMADDAFAAWKQEAALPFPIARLKDDADKTRVAWGATALPWPILTDKSHRVAAEGFALEELDAKLKQLKE